MVVNHDHFLKMGKLVKNRIAFLEFSTLDFSLRQDIVAQVEIFASLESPDPKPSNNEPGER